MGALLWYCETAASPDKVLLGLPVEGPSLKMSFVLHICASTKKITSQPWNEIASQQESRHVGFAMKPKGLAKLGSIVCGNTYGREDASNVFTFSFMTIMIIKFHIFCILDLVDYSALSDFPCSVFYV